MDEKTLVGWVEERAENLQIPGVSVGVLHEGQEHYAYHGSTSVDNPLPVDGDTLFQIGSTTKTFTATAIMVLVGQGKLDLDGRVRTYVPELRLKDESVAQDVTVLHLLNHTAGWSGDLMLDTGAGDDALARYVEEMAQLEQLTLPGAMVAYNNASLSLAGRVIEKVTGKTYERAVRDLLFEPLGLDHCYFFPNEIMTRRFAVGHNQQPDGTIHVARPWALARAEASRGGITSNARDQMTWARFHLGGGAALDGSRVLSKGLIELMQQPTAGTPETGEGVGIGWMLRTVDGVGIVEHGGAMNGQLSAFLMVPERRFAITSLTNCAPNGDEFNEELVRWALEEYLGVIDRDPEPIPRNPADLVAYVGHYETGLGTADVTVDGGGLVITPAYNAEVIAQLTEEGEAPPSLPPLPVGFLPGDGDRWIVTAGPMKGTKGHFVHDPDGNVEALHLGGRLATRVST